MKKIEFFLWVLLAVISLPILYVYKTNYGDGFFLEYFVTDLYGSDFSRSAWRMPPSPSYFPEIMVYALIYPLLHFATDRMFVVALTQISLITICLIWITHWLTPLKTVATQAVLVLMCILTFSSYMTDIWLFVHAGNYHIGTYIITFLLVLLVLRFIDQGKRVDIVFLIGVSTIAVPNGGMIQVTFLLPCIAALLSLSFFKMSEKMYKKRIFMSAAGIMAALFLGRFLNYKVHPSAMLDGRFTPSSGRQVEAWGVFMNTTTDLLRSGNVLHYFFFFASIMSFCYCIWIVLKRRAGMSTHFVALMVLFSLFTILAGSIYTGAFKDTSHRYFLTPACLAMSVVLAQLAPFIQRLKSTGTFQYIRISLIVFVLSGFLIFFDYFKHRKISLAEVRQHVGTHEKRIADCIHEAKQKHDLAFGISGFFDSEPVRVISELPSLRINQFTLWRNSLRPYHYMNNLNWYHHSDLVRPRYNFVIVDSQSDHYQMDLVHVRKFFGPETAKIPCVGVNAKILYYDGSTEFNSLVWRATDKFFMSGRINDQF